MATQIRVVVSHLDASGNVLRHFGQEQFLLNVSTVDNAGITSVLNSNGKKRGTSVTVHSYANLDKEHQGSPALLS